MTMNQKQREYLIKRLQKIAEEKKATFKVEDPNLEPFIKKLKVVQLGTMTDYIREEMYKINNYKPMGYNKKGLWQQSGKVGKFTVPNSVSIKDDFYFTNLKEVKDAYQEFCEKHYKVYDSRLKSVDIECEKLCDRIVFANNYEEAIQMIAEFSKF